jgi:DNA invertase Pin-like site-specific DNA recombinase
MGKAIAYLRVSTQRQHRSGLGIEAQRAAVTRFGEAEGITIIGEFVEAETGKAPMPSTAGLNLPRHWL